MRARDQVKSGIYFLSVTKGQQLPFSHAAWLLLPSLTHDQDCLPDATFSLAQG
jgi:hypothetical protein